MNGISRVEDLAAQITKEGTGVVFHFFLVRSPLRKITRCDAAKLDGQGELRPIVISKRLLKNHVLKDGIDHSLQLFGLSVPAYRTKVVCSDHGGEIVTYHLFLNRMFFIPIQILLALNCAFLAIATIGTLMGVITFPKGEFENLIGIFLAIVIMFYAFLFVMKFVGQLFARKNFKIIGDEVEAWLSA